MSNNTSKYSKVHSHVVLSLDEYKAINDEALSAHEKYSKVGHLYPERNTPQFQWFKGSRERCINKDLAA